MDAKDRVDTLGPFRTGTYDGMPIGTVDVEGRLSAVSRFGLDQCRRALEVPDLQKAVERAIQRRIKHLEKEQTHV